jgi:sporulation integral membrane protein YtvI
MIVEKEDGGEKMKEIRWERVSAIFVCILSGGALSYLLFRYALPLILPFLLAYAVSALVRPIANKLARRTRLPRGLCAVLLLLLVFGFGGWGLWAGSVRLIAELGNLVERLLSDGGVPDAMNSLMLWAENMGARFGFLGAGEGNAQAFYNAVVQMIGNVLSSVAARLPELAASLFSALPSVLLFLVVSVVACFYFCTDGVQITRTFFSFLPQKWQQKLPQTGRSVRDILHKYVKAYGILLALTFALLLVGFWTLRIEYAFLLAFLIALADLLPVIGVGTVLIPWGIVMLLQKNFYVGFGLLIFSLIISFVRQVAEPKVLGKSLGLHPLLTLFATYVGFSLFGILGMILAPVAALLGKQLFGGRARGTKT